MFCPGVLGADSTTHSADRLGYSPFVFFFFLASFLVPSLLWARGKPPEPVRLPNEVLIASESVWKYLDDGSDQGTAWIDPDFDDSGWAEGPARIGYGDDGEVTVVENGSEINGGVYMTTYLRHAFEVDEPSVLGRLQLRILRDDGVVVYLNGQEMARSNMPDGPINYRTRAASSVANEREQFFYLAEVISDNFVEGTNVLAVELHQFRNSSFDLGFDLELIDQTGSRFCFGVADGNNNLADEDLLVQLDVERSIPTVIGQTGTFGIEATAFEVGGERLFAADEGQIVLLDLTNGQATSLPQTAGSGDGALGPIDFDDLDGLTFDVLEDVLYASQRLSGVDVLIQLDSSTGAHIPDAFGPGIDYVPITGPGLPGDDIDDIASDPLTGAMFGLANERGGSTALVRIDKQTGATDLISILGVDDLEGLAFFNEGQLYGSTGTLAGPNSNKVFLIDKISGGTTEAAAFGIGTEFEGLGCLSDPGIGTLGDLVWEDLDADGIQDPGEPGYDGATVRLFDSQDQEIASTVTANGGIYRFEELLPSSYTVQFDLPTGFRFSPPVQGSDAELDSDAPNDGRVPVPLLLSSEVRLHIDAGIIAPGMIGDRVWEDLDGDGQQDVGEPGIASVTVELLDDMNNVLNTATTTSTGLYTFTGVEPGVYRVRFSNLPSDFTWTISDQGDDTLDSDIGINGQSGLILVESSGARTDIDAGAIRPTGVGDRSWHDLDADGIQDPGEPNLDGVVVDLFDADNQLLGSAVTTGGTYQFNNLFPGLYRLRFSQPNGFSRSPASLGGDILLDSDPAPADGQTEPFVLLSGLPRGDLDAGYFRPASLGDRVWHDLDGDGLQDPAEPGLDGVSVELLGTGGQIVASTTTSGGGVYLFTDLAPSVYQVRFTALSGYRFSPSFAGGDAEDSNADSAGMSEPIQLNDGETRTNLDAGMFRTASLGDQVWEDLDLDGIQDLNEPALDGVQVDLLDDAGVELETTTTAGGGLYSFRNLDPGSYRVVFRLPPSFFFSPVDQGTNDAFDSDAAEETGETQLLELLSGDVRTDVDAGMWTEDPSLVALVGDRVWEDLNGNGLQDAGEPGIAGVTVLLIDENRTPVESMVTGASGFYSFPSVAEGTYSIEIVPPVGYVLTLPAQGSDPEVDSDVLPGTGRTEPFTLASGESRDDLDAGLYLPASVGDFVWQDLDEDGVLGKEPGFDGALIELLDSQGQLVATTTTSGGGVYGFTGLMPGTYRLRIQLPEGLSLVPSGQGTDSEFDSDFEPSSRTTAPFTLSSGENRTDLDAGLGMTTIPVIPTLSTWGILLLGLLLAALGLRQMRSPLQTASIPTEQSRERHHQSRSF